MRATAWYGRWPRYDPNRGYHLCEHCWNGQHTRQDYTIAGKKSGQIPNCQGGGCGCGCRAEFKAPRKPKFTHAGQTEISMENPLIIGPKADQLKEQIEALKKGD